MYVKLLGLYKALLNFISFFLRKTEVQICLFMPASCCCKQITCKCLIISILHYLPSTIFVIYLFAFFLFINQKFSFQMKIFSSLLNKWGVDKFWGILFSWSFYQGVTPTTPPPPSFVILIVAYYMCFFLSFIIFIMYYCWKHQAANKLKWSIKVDLLA